MVRTNWHKADGPWKLKLTTKQDYDANKRLSVRIDSAFSSSIYGVKYTFTYDAKGNEILAHQYLFNLPSISNWTDEYRRTTTYTSFDSENTQFVESYNFTKSEWGNYNRTLHSYNSKNYDTATTYQEWDPQKNLWKKLSMYFYKFNANGQETESLYQEYDDVTQTFKNKDLTYYSYDASKRIATREELQFDIKGIWVYKWKYYYSYNAQGLLDKVLRKIWNTYDGVWEDHSTVKYTYDGNNRLQEELDQLMQNSSWKNSNRRSYTRDANGYHTRILYETWNNNTLSFQNTGATNFWYETKKVSGIHEKPDVKLNVYPNPSSNSLVFINADKNIAYEIYDLQGKVVQQGKLQPGTNSIILNGAKGNYILKAGNSSAVLVIQ